MEPIPEFVLPSSSPDEVLRKTQICSKNINTVHTKTVPQVTGLIASTWNTPMFGFVAQSSKMDRRDIYDSYINIVPPLKRSAEVLAKTLTFFGWTHVAMIGGGLETNTWDKVDDLWKTVENQLKSNFKLMAAEKFDTSNPQLISQKMKSIATVARGEKNRFVDETRHE